MAKRILLKLSGEQFAGKERFGIDANFVSKLAEEIREAVTETKAQLAIVVGGGNFVRGAQVARDEVAIERATADYMGMLATVLNGMALVDTLEHRGQPARLQTRIQINSVAEPYIRRRAIRHLEKGRIVIVAGGTGNPFVTTDTAAVSTALELDCELVMKATKVDGVYSSDPLKNKRAKKFDALTHLETLNNSNVKIMDSAAVSLAMDHHLPIVIFDLLTRGNIKKIIQGQKIGTLIK